MQIRFFLASLRSPTPFAAAAIVAAGVFAALAPMAAAHADEPDGSEHALQFQSRLARSDLARDADEASLTATTGPLLSQETAPPMERAQPGLTRDNVTAQAEEAQREGRIPYGEVGAAGE